MRFPTDEIMKKYHFFWQYPVITEQTFYNQTNNDPVYIGFPWATIIDKKYNLQVIYNILKPYISSDKEYYTCCQHISFRNILPLFEKLNIKTVFCCHKIKNEDTINHIKLLPCPLYAANIEDNTRNNEFKNVDLLTTPRKYLYSFQGAYNQVWYLTDIRRRIFEMTHPKNCYVKYIGDWHYEKMVYHPKQNIKHEVNESTEILEQKTSYNKLLISSRFSLCPSGSGPNSIRLWECIAIGTIPILLADTLELPKHELWDKAILQVSENKLHDLPDILSAIDATQEKQMRINCIAIYNHFKNNYKNTILYKQDTLSSPIQKYNTFRPIIHYCCGSYFEGVYGGVARFDYHIYKAFPHRIFIQGPRDKHILLNYLKLLVNPIVITDNHLACDVPNEYYTYLVHHGVAKTHAIRDPEWSEYWKNLCCKGQEKMLYYRDPRTTEIISISQFCTDEFTKYYGDDYTKFKNTKLLHTSDLDEARSKTSWNKTPIILGNWPDKNKGSDVVSQLKDKGFLCRQLNVHCINGNIEDFNKRKQDIYLESDIFLQLSLCEGNSYATIDAFLCGLVIVATNVGLFYKDVPDNCFVKIDWTRKHDIAYITEKINYAIANKETISNNASRWYMDNVRFSHWKKKIQEII